VRIERIVNATVTRATAAPAGARPTYIQEEVAKVRAAFRRTYEADARLAASAIEFVDSMTGWIEARIHALETEASGKTEADEGRAEL
jgi:hypothetical protein